MAAKSVVNISGCWSYLVEIYCLMAVDSWSGDDLRNGTFEENISICFVVSLRFCVVHGTGKTLHEEYWNWIAERSCQ